jgi:hypothetical protein
MLSQHMMQFERCQLDPAAAAAVVAAANDDHLLPDFLSDSPTLAVHPHFNDTGVVFTWYAQAEEVCLAWEALLPPDQGAPAAPCS